jgi:two-component system, chemotaxis family, CheB/CheR fusion protein
MKTQRDETPDPLQSPAVESLVVVGSSAGGIEALLTLVASLPQGFPAPIVIAQHLDPQRHSHLQEILASHSTLQVRSVATEEQLQSGIVYVVPADKHVEITAHKVRVKQQGSKRPKPSVDHLLSTAAAAFGERLIAVILTGTGSDGAAGAHAVKAAGGMVIIQNPATAAYPGMPASLAPTTVDIVADLERIGPLLYDLLVGVHVPQWRNKSAKLDTLLDQVREHSGIDFSHYKRPTMERRLQRRFVATGVATLDDYLRFLQGHPDEYGRLITAFLIKVTEFFRDADLFTALRTQVMPEIIAYARNHGNELRLWSAGCATGEEAYSLAMLVDEALGDELSRFNVQIFATDLDEEAIAFARRGVYSSASVAGLPADVLIRYFTRLDGTYEVTKSLRGKVTFGQHDLGQRPPFPRIDLVLCRNVLIYFTTELQRRALQLFAFALRDGGYLALGKAESVQPLATYYAPAHPRVTLFRRHGPRVLAPVLRQHRGDRNDRQDVPLRAARPLSSSQQVPPFRKSHIASQAESPFPEQRAPTMSETLDTVLLDLALGVAVVDANYDVQFINPFALQLLGIYKPAMGKDLIHLTTSIPTAALRTVIDKTFQAHEPSHMASETVIADSGLRDRGRLQISGYAIADVPEMSGAPDAQLARDLPSPPKRIRGVLLLISEVTDESHGPAKTAVHAAHPDPQDASLIPHDRPSPTRAKVEELSARLKQVSAVTQTLLEANQEFAVTNLALQHANEELLAEHEDAEASAEEVKALNEELQATNEELVTLNEEMEATVEELHASNDDLLVRTRELEQMASSEAALRQDSEARRARLEAILLSVGDAVLVVDSTGKPVLTNQAYAQYFGSATANLVAEDVDGRPLPREATPQYRAAMGEVFTLEFTLLSHGVRRHFEARGEPVRSEKETGLGGVVTIREITERAPHLQPHEAPSN